MNPSCSESDVHYCSVKKVARLIHYSHAQLANVDHLVRRCLYHFSKGPESFNFFAQSFGQIGHESKHVSLASAAMLGCSFVSRLAGLASFASNSKTLNMFMLDVPRMFQAPCRLTMADSWSASPHPLKPHFNVSLNQTLKLPPHLEQASQRFHTAPACPPP